MGVLGWHSRLWTLGYSIHPPIFVGPKNANTVNFSDKTGTNEDLSLDMLR